MCQVASSILVWLQTRPSWVLEVECSVAVFVGVARLCVALIACLLCMQAGYYLGQAAFVQVGMLLELMLGVGRVCSTLVVLL
jgi:hypothetical protein